MLRRVDVVNPGGAGGDRRGPDDDRISAYAHIITSPSAGMTEIRVGDWVESPGDLSRDRGLVIKLDDDSDFCLVAFRLAGEMALRRSKLHLVVIADEATSRCVIE